MRLAHRTHVSLPPLPLQVDGGQSIYKEVTEEEYAKVVSRRRKEADFVVQDGA
jgi:hypothetical protein